MGRCEGSDDVSQCPTYVLILIVFLTAKADAFSETNSESKYPKHLVSVSNS